MAGRTDRAAADDVLIARVAESDKSINTFDELGVTIEQRAGEQTPKGTLVLEYGF